MLGYAEASKVDTILHSMSEGKKKKSDALTHGENFKSYIVDYSWMAHRSACSFFSLCALYFIHSCVLP